MMLGARAYPALGFDPTPGDPLLLDPAVTVLRQTAAALDEIVVLLRGDAREVWRGQAAVAFQSMVDSELRPLIESASMSFSGAVRALDGWQVTMTSAQARSRRLEQQAAEALAELVRAQQAPDVPAIRGVSAAQETLDAVRRAGRRHGEEYETEADVVAAALQDAIDLAPNEPGWFGRIADGIGSVLDPVHRVGTGLARGALGLLENIAPLTAVVGEVLGVASFVLGLAAFFPPLAFLALPAVAVGGLAVLFQYAAISGEKGSFAAPFGDREWLLGAASVAAGGGAYRATRHLVNISRAHGGTKMVRQLTGRNLEVPVGIFEATSRPFRMTTQDFVARTVRLKFVQTSVAASAAQLPGAAGTARGWIPGAQSATGAR